MADSVNFVRLQPDDDYAYVVPSGSARAAFAEVIQRSRNASYGRPLCAKWNGSLDFVVDQEDIGQHPRGLGDCANLATTLYLIASPKALEVLTPFLIGYAELLPATLHGEPVTVVNVTRCIPPDQLSSVGPNDIFRVGPVGLDIFVGIHVRDAARAAGITGLAFAPVRATDAVQTI